MKRRDIKLKDQPRNIQSLMNGMNRILDSQDESESTHAPEHLASTQKSSSLQSEPGIQFKGFDRLPKQQYTFGTSKYVTMDPTNSFLKYTPYLLSQDKIIDFSTVGYANSEKTIPNVATVLELFPDGDGDDTTRIQQAIDSVGQMKADGSGFKGALLLNSGTYFVAGTLR